MRNKTVSVIFVGAMFLILVGSVPVHSADVNVNIGIGVPLPQVVIHESPPVIVIPGTYVYFAPDVGVEIFFFHGYWYRPLDGRWYRASGYDGPWHKIWKWRVPHVVRALPPDYRRRVRYDERIRYQDMEKNWQAWERDKHWDKRDSRHEIQNVRDNSRWETSSRSDGREWASDSPRDDRGKGKNARWDDREEEKNARGGKGKNKH